MWEHSTRSKLLLHRYNFGPTCGKHGARARTCFYIDSATVMTRKTSEKRARTKVHCRALVHTSEKQQKRACFGHVGRFLFLFTRATFDARTKPLTSAIHALCVSVE